MGQKIHKTIQYVAEGNIYCEIPNLEKYGASEIEIRLKAAPTFTGGSTPALVANTIVKELQLFVIIGGNIQQLERYAGDAFSNAPSWGIKVMRELNKLIQQVSDDDNVFRFKVPDNVPRGCGIIVEGIFNSLAYCTSGSPTAMEAYLEVCSLANAPKVKNAYIPRKINCSKKALLTATTFDFPVLLSTPAGFKATLLMLGTEDNGTFANDTLTEIEVWHNSKRLFKGSFASLQQQTKSRKGIACQTGMAALKLEGGLTITPESLKLIGTLSAGTAVDIHYALVSHSIVKAKARA